MYNGSSKLVPARSAEVQTKAELMLSLAALIVAASPRRNQRIACAAPSGGGMRGSADMIAAVLPMGPKDAGWLAAKIKSCSATLGRHMVAAVLIYAPRVHLADIRAALPPSGLPPHWHLLAEEDVVPASVHLGVGWRDAWIRQQIIKLLVPRSHAAWPASARYALALDSDTLCTHGWQGAGKQGITPGPSNTSALLETFVQSDGRIRGCVQPTSGWYGSIQLQRTGRF